MPTKQKQIDGLLLLGVSSELVGFDSDYCPYLIKRLSFDLAPETSMAIVHAVTEVAPEPLRLDRYRNELAASLLGVPPAKANTEGLITLRKLAASAPPMDSDVVYLPQQRALNVVKTCEKWIASDEDLDEEVESAMTWTFSHLAPILQNLEGSHWEFIFDVVENNLEVCLAFLLN